MKKVISGVLAATIITTNVPLRVLAEETDTNLDANNGTVEQKNTKNGYIEVDINLDMPIKYSKDSKIGVSLSDNTNTDITKFNLGVTYKDTFSYNGSDCNYSVEALKYDRATAVEENGKVYAYRVKFNNLPAGENIKYYINIEGNGFKGIAKEIELNNNSKRIVVNNLANKLETGEGTILFGDVNNDGAINDTDYKEVFDNIGTSNSEDKEKYDLDRSGTVDITDLTYVHKNIGKTETNATIKDTEAIIDLNKSEITLGEGITTNNEVNVEDILTDSLADSGKTLKLSKESTISTENPIVLDLDLNKTTNDSSSESTSTEGINTQTIVIKGGEYAPTAGFVTINDKKYPFGNYSEGTTQNNGESNQKIARTATISDDESMSTYAENTANKDIVINLGQQIAISKITITITDTTANDRNLTEIAKVEFLNDVYKEIPKPDMNIPQINKVETETTTGNESMTLHWKTETNVTGYELKVEEIDEKGTAKGSARIFRTSENMFKVRDVKAYSRYRVSIQSVNGEWEGGYKEADNNDKNGTIDNIDPDTMSGENATYTPKDFDPDGIVNIMIVPNSKPEPPEGIKATGKYKAISVSWKNHASAKKFDVYYRKLKTNENDTETAEFTKANKKPIENTTSYLIEGLEENASYEIKLTATNHLGTSGMSNGVISTTLSMTIPKTPNYRLINTPNGVNELTNHITSVEFPMDNTVSFTDEDAVVDNDYSTVWRSSDWDSGATYGSNRGPIVNFDKKYKINRVAVVRQLDDYTTDVHVGSLRIYNKETGEWEKHSANVNTKRDSNNGEYILLELDEPVEADKIQVNLSVYGGGHLTIAELKFYEYADVEGEVKKLFSDDLHLELRTKTDEETGKEVVDVTQEEINKIRTELNTPDPSSGEYNVKKEALLEEVEIANLLLNDKKLSEKVIDIDPLINGSGTDTGYGNDWQALGFSAKAGDEITIYMAQNENKTIKLGYEQHYAESGSFINQEKTLKPGKNTITLKKLTDLNVEKGGNLYVKVEEDSENSTADIKIRVSGATEIPHLNLNNYLEDVDYLVNKKDTDDEKVKEVKEKLRKYITELNNHVKTMASKYPENATEADNVKNIYSYDEKTSILNSTNIEGDRFTLTLPAKDVYEGITEGTNGDIDKQVDNLYNTVLAWEQIIQITNAKKGVFEKVADFNGDKEINEKDYNNATYKANKASKMRVNVKYQRMFIGAFMYASGHHVGIDVGSSKGLMKGVPYKFDENGIVTNPDEGQLFGWGISHEIGHKADTKGRVYSETSNNILALITQSFDGQDKTRLEQGDTYKSIYKRVTSGSVGVSQDISTLLGMFWQLQLAYEDSEISQMLKNNNDGNLENDSYWAKLNRAYRANSSDIGKIDRDQLLIRRASDAAGKDLRAFFASWGLIADESTKIYLQQKFSSENVENRKIQYLNDEAYRKRLVAKKARNEEMLNMSNDIQVEASFDGVESGAIVNGNSVTLNIDVDKDEDKILGYEIIRSDGNKLTEVKSKESNQNSGETQDTESENTEPQDTNKKYHTETVYRPVGFVNASEDGSATFTDNISPINNRAMTYKVVAYDYNLNATKEFEVGSVKLSHDGTIDSSDFVLKSNLTSLNNSTEADENKNENTVIDNGIDAIKDENTNTSFKGRKLTSEEYTNNPHKQEDIDINADPYIIMDLQGSKTVTGLKYTKSADAVSRLSLKRLVNAVKGDTTYSPISDYEIYISNDSEKWEKISEGTFDFGSGSIIDGTTDKNTAKVLFGDSSNVFTYDAKYVKLVAKGATNVDIAEISLIGSTGDNIEIGAINSNDNTRTNGIGKLEKDFVYDKEGNKIPAGSVIVTGEYKGNPAFNVPLLIDENNNTISGNLILMADVSEDSQPGEIASGKWIYWTTPENFSKLSHKVKTELYRYNKLNESGNPEGQRLVSDTLYVDVPKSYDGLDSITFENAGISRTKLYDNVKVVDTKNFVREEN